MEFLLKKPFIVVSDGFDRDLFEQLLSMEKWEVYRENFVSPEILEELLPRVEGLVVRSRTKVTSSFLKKCSRLQLIIRAGEGVDNIDLAACGQKGIKVANTPGANNNAVAEHTLGLIFSLLRKIPQAFFHLGEKRWEKELFVGGELKGKTVGIVGLGRIGRLLAGYLKGFDCRIVFYDPYVEQSSLAESVSLEALFGTSDVITLHVPFLPQTKNLVDKKLISLMKPTSFLVNTSRGGVVFEEHLIHALKERQIAGAALDVFAREPLPEDSVLRSLDNVILTPHLGASTRESAWRVGSMVIHQLKEFFLNKNLIHKVIPQ